MDSDKGREVWLSLGSNVANGDEKIRMAAVRLSESFRDFQLSSVYRTANIKNADEFYFNAVALFHTNCDLGSLNRDMKELESALGRIRDEKGRGEVTMDIDVVIYDGKIIREKDFRQDYFQIGYKEIARGIESRE